MKKLLFAMLFAAVLVAQASPAGAQAYIGSQIDVLNHIHTKLDSLQLWSPVPVTVSEHVIFTGLDMESTAQGTTSNLNMKAGGDAYRTFPVAGAPDCHGAKALYLVLDWTSLKHGNFKVEWKFGPSSADTLFNYFDGTAWLDSVVVKYDSSTVNALTGLPKTAASLVIRIPTVPGGGYFYSKITARDKVYLNAIKQLNATLVVVQ